MVSSSWYARSIRYNAHSSRSVVSGFMSFGYYVHNKVNMAVESQGIQAEVFWVCFMRVLFGIVLAVDEQKIL